MAPGSIVLRWPGIPGDLTLFSGGFSQAQCVPFGLVDYSKDRDCYGPGLDLYLKMVSTDYLGEIYRLVMIKAAERKLLSFGCSRDVLSLTWLDLDTLVDFLTHPETGAPWPISAGSPRTGKWVWRWARLFWTGPPAWSAPTWPPSSSSSAAGGMPAPPVCVGLQGTAFAAPP